MSKKQNGKGGHAAPPVRMEEAVNREYAPSRSPNFVKAYSNNVHMTLSTWDVRMIFGEIVDITDNKLKVEETVQVTMSPQHAKVFMLVLQKNLAKYEERFGEIKQTI